MSNNSKNSNKHFLTPDQAITAWTRICEGLYHFDNLSNRCRLLASTWLLASFGAIGYVSTQNLPVGPEILAPVLSVLSSLGVLVLWIMDQLVYIRFIEAYFSEAFEMERKYDFLPKVNVNMPVLFGKKGVISYVRLYYFGCMIAPILVALLSIFTKDILLQRFFLYTLSAIAVAIILSMGLYLFFQKPEYQKLLDAKRMQTQQRHPADEQNRASDA
jgi:amino acid permease